MSLRPMPCADDSIPAGHGGCSRVSRRPLMVCQGLDYTLSTELGLDGTESHPGGGEADRGGLSLPLKSAMKPIDRYPLDELKRVYRVLHAQLPEHPDLMDSALLHDLQSYLQGHARSQGVEVSLHAQWLAWLDQGG
jgi:hypothetical protein